MSLKSIILLAIVAITTVNAQGEIFQSQAETCSNAVFRLASEIDAGWLETGGFNNPFPVVAGQHRPTEGSFPNIEWDKSVPLAKWSLAAGKASANAPFPMGFRRNIMMPRSGGVMCLKIPSTFRNHKIEVMVESEHKQHLCITDTRTAKYNHSANKFLSQCDANGQMIACFSGLTSKQPKAVAQNGDEPNTVPVPQSELPEVGFALVIGCSGRACGENPYTLFYRVRASEVSWDTDFNKKDPNTGQSIENAGAALESLDVWCMMMESRDPVLGIAGTDKPTGETWLNNYGPRMALKRKTMNADGTQGAELTELTMANGVVVTINHERSLDERLRPENMFPQYFPSDLWAPIWTAADEARRLQNEEACERSALGCEQRAIQDNEKFNPFAESAASTVLPSLFVFVVTAPLVALLF